MEYPHDTRTIWHIALVSVSAIVGVIAAISLIAIYAPAPVEYVPVPISASTAPIGGPVFLRDLSFATHEAVETGESVQPILDGSDFFDALIDDIGHATSSIEIADFPWDHGALSQRMFTSLTEAANRGVSVRVILDSFGGWTVPHSWILGLKKAGGKVVEYHPFLLADPLRYNVRDHERIFVVDSAVAYTGGMGVVDYWIGPAKGYPEWRDAMFEERGSMVSDMNRDFDRLWAISGGKTEYASPTGVAPSSVSATSAVPYSVPYIFVAGAPTSQFQPIRDAFLYTIASAHATLYIESPYIVPDRELVDLLEAKARAGVDVRIISPGPITSGPILRSVWHAYYAELLQSGVRLYEYQPSMIHSKVIVADGAWSLIGSANMDSRSEAINDEDVIGIADPALANELDRMFMADIESSKEITLADWSHEYGWLDRAASEFWMLFEREL
jgi:cardiolipin synthase A/B